MTAIRAGSPPASSTKRERMTRSPSLSSAPPMTMTGPTGPPSVVGASRCGAEASVIHDSVLAAVLRRLESFCEFLYAWYHIVRRLYSRSAPPRSTQTSRLYKNRRIAISGHEYHDSLEYGSAGAPPSQPSEVTPGERFAAPCPGSVAGGGRAVRVGRAGVQVPLRQPGVRSRAGPRPNAGERAAGRRGFQPCGTRRRHRALQARTRQSRTAELLHGGRRAANQPDPEHRCLSAPEAGSRQPCPGPGRADARKARSAAPTRTRSEPAAQKGGPARQFGAGEGGISAPGVARASGTGRHPGPLPLEDRRRDPGAGATAVAAGATHVAGESLPDQSPRQRDGRGGTARGWPGAAKAQAGRSEGARASKCRDGRNDTHAAASGALRRSHRR